MCSDLCVPRRHLVVAILLLLQCIFDGAAIKCFVCDSSDNPSCANLQSNSSIVPEECSLEKMKSIDTWLFELNKFAYFDTGANKSPLMNCQKVVARDPNTNKMVTARFCQLNTGDSDACSILHSKLRITADDAYSNNNNNNNKNNNNNNNNNHNNNHNNQNNINNNYNNNNNKKRKQNSYTNNNNRNINDETDNEDPEEQFHCSICTTDRCNGGMQLHRTFTATGLVIFTALLLLTWRSAAQIC